MRWYGTNSCEIVEIVLRDYSGTKIDSFRFQVMDKKRRDMVFNILYNKYGIGFTEEKPKREDLDLNWIPKE